MKLSEAIRLGSMLKPQGFQYMDFRGKTCALGAAAEAGGFTRLFGRQVTPRHEMRQRWPILATHVGACPRCSAHPELVELTVTHLNDQHRWTRERIADWVETIELRSTEPATAPVEEFAEILSVATR